MYTSIFRSIAENLVHKLTNKKFNWKFVKVNVKFVELICSTYGLNCRTRPHHTLNIVAFWFNFS